MRWILVTVLALAMCAAAYGAWIENVACMTYDNPYTEAQETACSEVVRVEVLAHYVDVVATAEPIP